MVNTLVVKVATGQTYARVLKKMMAEIQTPANNTILTEDLKTTERDIQLCPVLSNGYDLKTFKS